MSLEKPYMEVEEEEDKSLIPLEQPLTPLKHPMKNIKIASTSDPSKIMAVSPKLALKQNIVLAPSGTYSTWNYSDSGIISLSQYPTWVIAAEGKTDGSKVYIYPLSSTPSYVNWIWNPTKKTFHLAENPEMILVTNLSEPDTTLYLAPWGDNMQWMIVCTEGSDFNQCKDWCIDNPAECRLLKGRTCANMEKNMGNVDFCRDFCITATVDEKKAYCNDNMEEYCNDSANTHNIICGCLNTKMFPRSIGFCYDPKCINNESYFASTQPLSACAGGCIQYISGSGSDYYQKVKQTMCCDKSSGKLTNRDKSGVVCSTAGGNGVPSKRTDTTIFGIIGLSSSSSLSCILLLIIIAIIYYLLK